MRNLILISALALFFSGKPGLHDPEPASERKELPELTLTILYDNYLYDNNFRNSWGFSCLIEGTGETILFDTGGKDGNLMLNLEAAGRDPGEIDLVILSHNHWDHTGGLSGLLQANPDLDVYMPASFPEQFREEVLSLGGRPVMVEDYMKISDHVFSSGEMGREIIEQAVFLETGKGMIILTGCAHPGIEEIVSKASEMQDEEILLVMGGFHLLRTGIDAVEEIALEFRKMGVNFSSPTHCSGDGTIGVFKEVFADHYLQAGAGRVIRTAELN